MQDAIPATAVPAHRLDARLDIAITEPASACEQLFAESIIRRYTPESWQ